MASTTTEIKLPQWAKRCGYTKESFAAWQEGVRKQVARAHKQEQKWEEKYQKLPLQKKFWVREMNLRPRARKALSRLGVETIRQVSALSESSFALIRNCGSASVNEIRQELKRLGFDFKSE